MTEDPNNPSDELEQPVLELPALPPVIFGVPVILGVLIHVFLLRFDIVDGVVGIAIGTVLILVGLLMIYWSWITMRAHGEHPEPGAPTRTLVVSGPFKYSRNPIYLAFVLIAAGFAFALSALVMLISVFFGAVALTVLVIRREEAYLGRMFGDAYAEYLSRTRRWL